MAAIPPFAPPPASFLEQRELPAEFLPPRQQPAELGRNAMASLGARPPRASLVNLATDEQYDFMFNPQTWKESVQAKYNRLQINGLSHERLGYKNTTNDLIPLELYLSQLAQDQMAGQGDSSPPIGQQKAWLQSLCYPVASQDYGYVGPPQVLFIWPHEARMICKVLNASFLHRTFSNRSLASVQIVATLTLEEDVQRRRLMEEVQLMGSITVEEDL
jgi:hypothetical protein